MASRVKERHGKDEIRFGLFGFSFRPNVQVCTSVDLGRRDGGVVFGFLEEHQSIARVFGRHCFHVDWSNFVI